MVLFPLSRSELRTLRLLFFVPVLVGARVMVLDGLPIGASVVSGGVLGGYAAIPLYVFFLYCGRQSS